MDKNPKCKSTLGMKNMPNRQKFLKSADIWLEEKRIFDGAKELWRVHDNIYDLTDFIDNHPGGKFWLDATKGTDITEAFETHHISTVPEAILKKYYVRKAKSPRNSPFTFKEDGFYKTLKRDVREALQAIPKCDNTKVKVITDSLLVGSFAFAILASAYWNYTFAIFSGILLSSLVTASHNFGHQKDNFRMYYGDIGMLPSREMRITHILSHHLYTNTVVDMQAYNSEPMINLYPHIKSRWAKYASWIYVPFLLWPTMFYFAYTARIYQKLFTRHTKSLGKVDILATLLPLSMYLFSGQPFLKAMGMFMIITAVNGFCFGLVGVTSSHFHPDIFIDGDTPRPEDQRDWGINQLDTVSDRYEVTGNLFLVLLTFGDHALHHLFPTLDHGILHHLYPVVQKTMKKFPINIRMTSQADMFGGYFRQLARDKPNPYPPNLGIGKGAKYY